MKKFYSIAALALMLATGASAQTETPNRLIVQSPVGAKAYALDKVDSIYFVKKEGDVRADVEFLGYTKDETRGDVVTVKVTRTDPNSSFAIDILPTNTASRYDDDTMARYFDMQSTTTKFYQDFTSGELTGFAQELAANSSYTIVTLAYDEYGVPCQCSRAEFKTPKAELIDNPSVTYTIDDLTSSSVTLTVTPNDDCTQFYWCQFDKDDAESQFQKWGPMFGFACIEDMVKQFSGSGHAVATTNTWSDLARNTDYEVLVVPTDENGNYGEIVTIYFTTKKKGGEGVAEVDINVGKFEQYDEKIWTQTVTFTPNENVSVYHDLIFDKSVYDAQYGDEWTKSYFTTDQTTENPYWNQYTTDVYRFQADFNSSYYALAMAKNVNDEWGPLAKKEFTTPASPSNVAVQALEAVDSAVKARIAPKNVKRAAIVPTVGKLNLVNVK